MMVIQSAFTELYPQRTFNYTTEITYSGKFKPYNARVLLRSSHLRFNLSREWKTVDGEIVKGLYQVLLARLFGGKTSTFNMKLYHSFLKKLPEYTEAKESDPQLVESFQRVNNQYFAAMEQPTLVWGQSSTSTLAHYNLQTDTITMSTIFKGAQQHLMDSVMYHEMLHKKHQFSGNGARQRFHTKAFRDDEKNFMNAAQCELELKQFLRTKRKRWSFW